METNLVFVRTIQLDNVSIENEMFQEVQYPRAV